MTENATFRIVTTPRPGPGEESDATTTALAKKFRELRLRALKLAPDAFASTYDDESQRGLEHTLERMGNEKATHFIALKEPISSSPAFDGNDEVERMLSAEWLGLIVLLGPQKDDGSHIGSENPYLRMTAATREKIYLTAKKHPVDAPEVLHFHLNAVFVAPSARGGGLGGALVDAAVGRAKAEAVRLNIGLRISIVVYGQNVAARNLYERVGFQVIQERESMTRPGETVIDLEMSQAAAP